MPFLKHLHHAAAGAKISRQHTYGILPRILFPLGAVVALQFLLLMGGIYMSGLREKLNDTVVDSLQQTVNARAGYLQYDMVNRWQDVDSTVSALNQIYHSVTTENGISAQELTQSSKYYDSFLTQAGPQLVSLMRKNAVTGAYIILRSGTLASNSSVVEQLPGLYLRDVDPLSSYTATNDDIMLERAPLSLTFSLGLSSTSTWRPFFSMAQNRTNEVSFFRPYNAARANAGLPYTELAYWSKPYSLESGGSHAISYSVPLIAQDGTLYGVLGVEAMTDYIQLQLPANEVMGGQGVYALCVQDSHGGLAPILVSSEDAAYNMDSFSGLTTSWDERAGYYRLTTSQLSDLDACAHLFDLYPSNTPNSGDTWILFAAVPHSTVTELSSQITLILRWVLFIGMLLMLAAVLLISYQLSRPISRLEREVRLGIGHSLPLSLTRSGIAELNSLAQGVEALRTEVIRSEGKLSQILAMSSTNLGAFEFDRAANTAFSSEGFFRVFGRPDIDTHSLGGPEFAQVLRSYDSYILADSVRTDENRKECVYELKKGEKTLWVRMSVVFHGDLITGLAEDITREWCELHKLAFERDHDALTGIYNRRAFYERYHAMFIGSGGNTLGCAALIMLDLDNLKYVNDTYGHDYGDTYIRTAAQILVGCCPPGALAARMSGDEFFLFLRGYHSYDEVQAAVDELRRQLAHRRMCLPNGTDTPVRASAGIAWYPKDTHNPDLLIRYADFAMYKGKHSKKGTFVNFDYAVYCQEAYLLQGKESLNCLIEQGRVEYYFQPILEVRTGRVFACEALMRPLLSAFKSPMDVLTLARQESKLGEIERMTWFMAMKTFTRLCGEGAIDSTCNIFINSVSNQILAPEDIQHFEEAYTPWLSRIVQEHTEEEQNDPSMLRHKQEYLSRWNAHLALDDYGSGYNGENVLVSASPDYVKIDMAIVRGVDKDLNKQQLISGLLAYTRPRGIHVIAEGIETQAEMEKIVSLGVEYLQGYYVARPAARPPVPDVDHVQAILDTYHRCFSHD